MATNSRIVRRSTGRQTLTAGAMTNEDVRDVVLDGLLSSRKSFESAQVKEGDDAYNALSGAQLEAPPYNLQALAALVDRSNVLRQCIDAYVTNIESTGYHLEYIGPEGQEESVLAKQEADRLTALMDDPNGEYSMIELRERTRRDRESIGAGVMEVVRETGEIMAAYHLPAHTMYLTKRDREPAEVVRWVRRKGKLVAMRRRVYFRRYVQVIGARRTFFKEYGDPRRIDATTGLVLAKDAAADRDATEVIYIPGYKSGYTYGVPRYMHQLPSILGSREAELGNLNFFKNNAIPAMMVTVSGGNLTQETFEDVKSFFGGQGQGGDMQHRVIVMEVAPSAEGASQSGSLQPPKVEVKALQNDRQSDALFQEYDKENQKKVRSAFRLNPLFVGLSEDMTYATAQASMEMSEQQVFAPERAKMDEVINLRLLADATGKPPQYWWVRSNAPRITNPTDIINALPNLATVGALTPNVAINIANELFGLDVKPIDEPWGDVPYSATTALMAKGMVTGFENVLGREYPVAAPTPFGGAPADGGGSEPPPAKSVAVQASDAAGRPPRKRVLLAGAQLEEEQPGPDRAGNPPKQFQKYKRQARALPQKRRRTKD